LVGDRCQPLPQIHFVHLQLAGHRHRQAIAADGQDAAITQRHGNTLLSAEIDEPLRPRSLLARQAQGIDHGEWVAALGQGDLALAVADDLGTRATVEQPSFLHGVGDLGLAVGAEPIGHGPIDVQRRAGHRVTELEFQLTRHAAI
jgi:hypothetical protein